MAHTLNPSPQEAQTEGSQSSRLLWSTIKFWDCQGYTEKPCLKKPKQSKAKQTCLYALKCSVLLTIVGKKNQPKT